MKEGNEAEERSIGEHAGKRRAGEELLPPASQLLNLIEQSLLGIFIIRDRRFVYVNPTFTQIFGYAREELLSSVMLPDLICEEDGELVDRNICMLLNGEIKDMQCTCRMVGKEGTTVDCQLQGAVTYSGDQTAVIGSLLAVSSCENAECLLQKTQKLDSLGVLAVELANPFNNILTALVGNIRLAKMYAKPGSEVSDILSEAEKAALKAQDLTGQLSIFSNGDIPLRQSSGVPPGNTPQEMAGEKVFPIGDKRILVMDDEDMVRKRPRKNARPIGLQDELGTGRARDAGALQNGA